MVNPIYQQGEELLLNQFGSKYLGVAAHTNVNSNEFIVQEDAVISVLTGGDSSTAANDVDYKASMSLSGVTLKQGALIVAPQGESFQSMTIDSGTIMAYNSVVGGTKPGAVQLLLDLYPDAAAAYSLRKLRTDYTGPAIEVRKTVGGETSIQNIGFVNGELDTTSLLSFADGGDVFVTKWYDQSGEGNDVAQISQSAQPKIVSSGIVIERNGTPAVKFDGTDDNISNFTSAFINTTDVSYFSVSNNDVSESAGVIHSQYSINNYTIRVFNDRRTTVKRNLIVTSSEIITYTSDLASYSNTANQRLLSAFIDSSKNMSSYKDGVVGTTDTYVGTTENNGLVLGSQVATRFLNGTIQEVIAYNSDQSENKAGIESNINSNYNIYWDGSQTGLLDDYPNAAAAYSLRALNSAYTGAAIEVRRSSDNAVQDIGFLYDGSLDTASLLSFANGGDVFVAKWYDQSGVGNNDATQVSQSAQPQIVSSGSVINENGKISVKFNGTTDYIQNELSVGGTVTTFAVSKIVDELDFNFIYDSFGGTGNPYQIGRVRLGCYNIGKYFADNGDGQTANPTTLLNGLQNLFFAKHTNSNVSISVNQDALQTRASTNFYSNTEYFVIGARNDGAEHFLEGTIQELILYPSDQSGNRAAIETNINTHYTIY